MRSREQISRKRRIKAVEHGVLKGSSAKDVTAATYLVEIKGRSLVVAGD